MFTITNKYLGSLAAVFSRLTDVHNTWIPSTLLLRNGPAGLFILRTFSRLVFKLLDSHGCRSGSYAFKTTSPEFNSNLAHRYVSDSVTERPSLEDYMYHVHLRSNLNPPNAASLLASSRIDVQCQKALAPSSPGNRPSHSFGLSSSRGTNRSFMQYRYQAIRPLRRM